MLDALSAKDTRKPLPWLIRESNQNDEWNVVTGRDPDVSSRGTASKVAVVDDCCYGNALLCSVGFLSGRLIKSAWCCMGGTGDRDGASYFGVAAFPLMSNGCAAS